MTTRKNSRAGAKAAPKSAPPARARLHELHFVPPDVASFLAVARTLSAAGRTRFFVCGDGEFAGRVAGSLMEALPNATIRLGRTPEAGAETVAIYAGQDAKTLADALLTHVDDRQTAIVAPAGADLWSNRPLYLISIPKSGTHLLFELAKAFGYNEATSTEGVPRPGNWYCVENSNTHTSARRFLVDTVAASPLGGRDHPFLASPALFIYRDPRDILCSEAEWFHKPGNSPLAGYFAELDKVERVERLLSDPWVLGSIRDRVGEFVPWLSFPNVIPLSFEELVGAEGGSDQNAQLDLIWSLQLKLQVPGKPSHFAAQVFNPNSPTFARGRVGSWKTALLPEQRSEFDRLPQDFMKEFGYPAPKGSLVPARADEFRRRALRIPDIDTSNTPIAVAFDYLDANIVKFRSRYYVLPQAMGPVDLAAMSAEALHALTSAETLDNAKAAWLRQSSMRDSETGEMTARLAALDGRLAALGDKFATEQLRTEISSARAQIETLAQALAASDDPANEAIAELRAALAHAREQIEVLRKERDELAGPMRQIEYRAAAAEGRVVELSRENERLRDANDEIERERTGFIQSQNELRAQLKSAQSAVEAIKSEGQAMLAAAEAAANAERLDLQAKVAAAEAAANAERLDLQAKVAAAEAAANAERLDLQAKVAAAEAAANAERLDLQAKVAAAEAAANAERLDLQAKVSAAEAASAALQAQLKEANSAGVSEKEAQARLSAEIAALQRKLELRETAEAATRRKLLEDAARDRASMVAKANALEEHNTLISREKLAESSRAAALETELEILRRSRALKLARWLRSVFGGG